MFWIGGYSKLLAPLMAAWCIALSMHGSFVPIEQTEQAQNPTSVSSTAVPTLEISDTSVYQNAHRLTEDNLHFKSLASATRLQNIRTSQVCVFGGLTDRRDSAEGGSLFRLGTALRL